MLLGSFPEEWWTCGLLVCPVYLVSSCWPSPKHAARAPGHSKMSISTSLLLSPSLSFSPFFPLSFSLSFPLSFSLSFPLSFSFASLSPSLSLLLSFSPSLLLSFSLSLSLSLSFSFSFCFPFSVVYNLESSLGQLQFKFSRWRGHVQTQHPEDRRSLEGSSEVKLPTIWRNEAAEVGRGREEKESEEKKSEEKESVERSRCTHR